MDFELASAQGWRTMHLEIGNVPEQSLVPGGHSMSDRDGLEHAQSSTAGNNEKE